MFLCPGGSLGLMGVVARTVLPTLFLSPRSNFVPQVSEALGKEAVLGIVPDRFVKVTAQGKAGVSSSRCVYVRKWAKALE